MADRLTCTPFSTISTNIFPIANSTVGGQLLTEYNLKSRESVGTDSSIDFICGLSYAHSMDDFALTKDTNNSTQIVISSGRAVIDGHYVESLTPIHIDIAELNANAVDKITLSGDFEVGLRIMYSDTTTMNGAIDPGTAVTPWWSGYGTYEDTDYFQGIQVVIAHRVYTPKDKPTQSDWTDGTPKCHLKLGSFVYKAGSVVEIVNNPSKIQIYDSDRISDLRSALKDEGVLIRPTLDPNMLYVYSPNGANESWCKASSALMVWDKLDNTANNKVNKDDYISSTLVDGQAEFVQDGGKGVALVVPHKQVDGGILENTEVKYWKDRIIEMPNANYSKGTAGIVSKAYTDEIKRISTDIEFIKRSGIKEGTMRAYYPSMNWDTRKSTQRDNLTLPIPTDWNVGDYVLVRSDYTVDSANPVASMYIVTAGEVTELDVGSSTKPASSTVIKTGSLKVNAGTSNSISISNATVTASGNGLGNVRVGHSAIHDVAANSTEVFEIPLSPNMPNANYEALITPNGDPQLTASIKAKFADKFRISARNGTDSIMPSQQFSYMVNDNSGSMSLSNASVTGSLSTGTLNNVEFGLSYVGANIGTVDMTQETMPTPAEVLAEFVDGLVGRVGDYVTVIWTNDTDEDNPVTTTLYYAVKTTGTLGWSDPIQLTEPIVLASENVIGGFYNIDPDSSETLGQGYVYVDADGHLRIADFALLAGKTFAYVISNDWKSSVGLDRETLQLELDDYINNRIAYPMTLLDPTNFATAGAMPTYSIHIIVNLSLSDDDGSTPLYIHNISSMFNTTVRLTFTGTVSENTKIFVSDCERLILDAPETILSSIWLKRSELYYDATVLNTINIGGYIGEELWDADIRLWTLDANLSIVDNVVTYTGTPTHDMLDMSATGTDGYNIDIHIGSYVKGIIFDTSCNIIGMDIAIEDNIAKTLQHGDLAVTYLTANTYQLPVSGFTIPTKCLTNAIRADGNYISMYYADDPSYPIDYITKSNEICVYIQAYNSTTGTVAPGQIVFKSTISRLPLYGDLQGVNPITASNNGEWHTIHGYAYNIPDND